MQLQFHHQQLHHQQQQMQQSGKTAMSSYQPSESDFSFDMCTAAGDATSGGGGGGMAKHGGGPSAQQRTNVQRSVSQPECAAEKSLFK